MYGHDVPSTEGSSGPIHTFCLLRPLCMQETLRQILRCREERKKRICFHLVAPSFVLDTSEQGDQSKHPGCPWCRAERSRAASHCSSSQQPAPKASQHHPELQLAAALALLLPPHSADVRRSHTLLADPGAVVRAGQLHNSLFQPTTLLLFPVQCRNICELPPASMTDLCCPLFVNKSTSH